MSARIACRKLQGLTLNILLNKPLYLQHVLQKECNFLSTLTSKCNYSKITNVNVQYQSGNKFEEDQEKDLLFAKNDPDRFGPISSTQETNTDDSGDLEEEEYLMNPPSKSQKLGLKEYALIIKDHLEHNRIKEAIDVLEIRMAKEDRVKPGKYIYNLLISGCAKAGYSKKAFQLYNKMKQRALKVTPSTYTSLFNACANSPWSQDGLNKANRLREIMLEKGYTPNTFNYNAMIKAYGRCGDIKTAYQIADEMMEKNMNVNTETFNFLLQACASDMDYGFRHALLTWHRMLKRSVNPDLYTFNIMLRCVRDCSIGDLETMEEVLTQIISNNDKEINKRIQENNDVKEVKQITEPQESLLENVQNENIILTDSKLNNKISKNSKTIEDSNMIINSINSSTEIVEHHPSSLDHQIVDETPNLLCRSPHLGSLISISEVKTAEDRLLLLGGFSGVLKEMKNYKITPGIQSFTILLEVIPSTIAAEKKLISMIRKIGLKADIDFFNMLIKKRSMRFDYVAAKEVLNMIKTAKLHPDIITYGVLALGCQTQEDARELLNEMQAKGIRMNIQILGAMLRQGCAHKNFKYVNEILQITLDEKIKPNQEFLKHLHNFEQSCRKVIYQQHPSTTTISYRKDFSNFKNKLNVWNEEWNIKDLKLEDAIKRIQDKPYAQFKEKQNSGFEEIKNEKLLKKQKNSKIYKKNQNKR